MTWKTHLIGGIAACAGITQISHEIFATNINMDTLVPALIISGVSALLPDVDEIKSKAGRVLLPISLLFFIMQSIVKIAMVITYGNLRQKIKENTAFLMHHGICHYPITILFISTTACLVTIVLPCDKKIWLTKVVAFTIGLLSHIILDILSGKIALLYPFNKKKLGIRMVETGGSLEKIIVRPTLLILCIMTITKIVR